MAKNSIELYGDNGLAVRVTAAQVSDVFELGADGYATGLLSVTNGLDQNVTVTIQGMNDGDSTWQTDGTVAVATAATGSYTITTPWGLVRLSTVAAGIPTSGALQVRATRLVASAATGGGAGTTVITDITGFATVAGQKAMAASFPVVVASDQSTMATDPVDDATRDLGKVDIAGIDAVGTIAGQKAMTASLPVVVANNQSSIPVAATAVATEVHVGQVGSEGTTISLTPAITGGLYAAGDAVGDLLTFANAARNSGGGGVIKTVVIIDDAGQDAGLQLWLFSVTFTPMTDNNPWAPAEADLENLVGVITTDDSAQGWLAAGTPSAITIDVATRYDVTGTSLFGQLVTPVSTPTYVATDDLTVKVGLLTD